MNPFKGINAHIDYTVGSTVLVHLRPESEVRKFIVEVLGTANGKPAISGHLECGSKSVAFQKDIVEVIEY